jgi:hypothetical protein
LCAAIEFVDDDLIEKLYIKILNHLVEECACCIVVTVG